MSGNAQQWENMQKKYRTTVGVIHAFVLLPEDEVLNDAIQLLGQVASEGLPPKLHSMKTEDLYAADPNCDHKNDPWHWNGAKCLYCPGWYCA